MVGQHHRGYWDGEVLAVRLILALALAVGAYGQQFSGSIQPAPSTLAATGLSAANTAVTVTLPAVAGQFHYLTHLVVQRTGTTALVGSAALAITTTNLPGSLAYTAGNACAIGSTNNDVVLHLSFPLKSSVVNTATTFVCPAAGAAVVCRVSVLYFTGP